MEPNGRFRPETGPSGETRRTGLDPKPTPSEPVHGNRRQVIECLGNPLSAVNDNPGPGPANAHMFIATQLLVRLPNAAALVTMDWNSSDVPTPSIAAPKWAGDL